MTSLRNTVTEYVFDLLTSLRAVRPRNLGSIPGIARNFLLLRNVLQNVSEASSSLPFSDYRGLFPWGKRPGRKGDQSSLSSAETKNAELYLSFPSYAFMTYTGTALPLFFLPLPCV